MNDREAQFDKLEDRLRQWGANTHARNAAPKPLPPIGTPARWPAWVWRAPIAVAAGLAMVVAIGLLFQMRTMNRLHENAARDADALAPLVAEQERLEGELAQVMANYKDAIAAQDKLAADAEQTRQLIAELRTQGDDLKFANAEMLSQLVEQAETHADQMTTLTAEADEATASAESLAELLRWDATTVVECQAFIRAKQLLARGNAIVAASPDSYLGQFGAFCQSYTMRVSLVANDPASIGRLVEMMETSNVVSRLEDEMETYANDPEVFLWLAQTHAVLSKVAELA